MVSVIVPVYNVAKYLPACLQSISDQTCQDIEVILVNDGSSDASGKICDEWAQRNPKFRVIHQANQGMSMARNIGIDNAVGEYLCFVDSDDLLHPKMIETMLGLIGDNEMAICSQVIGDECHWPEGSVTTTLLEPRKAIEMMLYQDRIMSSVWGKLFKRRLFAYLRFRPGILYEDLDLAYLLMGSVSGMIVSTDQPLYFYRRRKGSEMHTYKPGRLDVLDVVDRIEQYYGQHPKLKAAARDRKFAANYNIFGIAGYCDVPSEVTSRCWAQIKELRGEVLRNPKSRFKNKLGAMISYLGPKATLKITKLMYR